MTSLETLLLLIAAGFVVWATVTSVRIGTALQRRQVKVSWVWYRLYFLKYLGQYKSITTRETGRPGPLFWQFVIPINIALLCVLIFAGMRLI